MKDGKISNALGKLYESFGYLRFKMNKFEEYDTYVENKSFLTSDNVITFTDTNGKLMALKPDVTLSIVKNSKDEPGIAKKVYYNENVYRVASGSGAFKEIMQSGLECVGDVGSYELSEVIGIALESLRVLSSECVLDVSHLGIVSAAMEIAGLSEVGKNKMRALFSGKNVNGAEALLEEEGASEEGKKLILSLMRIGGTSKAAIPALLALSSDKEYLACVNELKEVLSVAGDENLRVDFSVMNDMRYYNGVVFQGFVKGVARPVLSGGQYDLLLKKMKRSSKAVGFAVYLDEIEEEADSALDVDVLILFREGESVGKIAEAVRAERAKGKKVIAEKKIPSFLRYGEVKEL
ncbi:MAG: ATP phosphoribosyltransferase regulatory subunit [Clostridia bacterium]|nr:ATP phosphoribosyltransferase regulatory subunit [Clostridia bacterium]